MKNLWSNRLIMNKYHTHPFLLLHCSYYFSIYIPWYPSLLFISTSLPVHVNFSLTILADDSNKKNHLYFSFSVFSSLLFSSRLFSSHMFSFPLFSRHLISSLLMSSLLCFSPPFFDYHFCLHFLTLHITKFLLLLHLLLLLFLLLLILLLFLLLLLLLLLFSFIKPSTASTSHLYAFLISPSFAPLEMPRHS